MHFLFPVSVWHERVHIYSSQKDRYIHVRQIHMCLCQKWKGKVHTYLFSDMKGYIHTYVKRNMQIYVRNGKERYMCIRCVTWKGAYMYLCQKDIYIFMSENFMYFFQKWKEKVHTYSWSDMKRYICIHVKNSLSHSLTHTHTHTRTLSRTPKLRRGRVL